MEFTCFGCGSVIQSEIQMIGEWVKCPMCSTSHVVPDPIIPNGEMYCKNYTVKNFEDENMLWQSYRVRCARDAASRDAVLRMPSTFFIKNVADLDAFSEAASFGGWENIEGFAQLTDKSTVKGKEYFVYDVGEDFIPLGTYVEKQGPIGVKVAVSIISGIASSFSKSWKEVRVSHLNLCPSTICLSAETMKPLILDMGLSMYLLQDKALHEKGFHVWDVRYMSPEIRNGEGPYSNPSADIYSLGAVLYFMIAGVHPFKDQVMKKYEKFPEFPVGIDVPETLRAVVLKMTAHLPEYRFYSWDDLISALDKLMDNMDKTEVDISFEGSHAIKEQSRALRNTMDSSRTCTGITQTYMTVGIKIKLDELRAQNNDGECDNTIVCPTDSIPEVQGIAGRKLFNVDFRFMVATISVAASVILVFLMCQTYTDRYRSSMDAGDINPAVPDANPKTSCRPVPAGTVAVSENNSRDVNLKNDIIADPELRSTANALLTINDAPVHASQASGYLFNETPIKAAPVVLEKPYVKESEKEKPIVSNIKPEKVNTVPHEKAVDSKKTMDDELMKSLLKLVAGRDFAKAREFIDKHMPVHSGDEDSELSSIRRSIGDLSRLNDVIMKELEDKKPGFKISFVQGGILCEGELISFTNNDLWVATTMGKNKIKTKISLDVLSPDTVISLAGGSISGEALMLFAYLKASELGDAISSRKYWNLSQGALSRYLKGRMRIAKNFAD